MRLRVLLLVSFVLVAPGCFGGKNGQRSLSPCARAARAARTAPTPHAVPGDVDGDGRAEKVSVVTVDAPRRCDTFLVVSSRHIPPLAIRSLDQDDTAPPPSLVGLGRIDTRPGYEIVVMLSHGASTAFASVFTVRRHRVRLVLGGPSFSQFAYGGSVTHVESADCVTPGVVVQYRAGPEDAQGVRWGVVRDLYRVVGSRFERSGTTRRHFSSPEAAFRYMGVGPQPFPSCLAVRSR